MFIHYFYVYVYVLVTNCIKTCLFYSAWSTCTFKCFDLVWADFCKYLKKVLISTTVHAMTKSFVPFCSAQDGKSADTNCLVFQALCKNGKFLVKRKVYNKGFSPILGNFSRYEILISLEWALGSEWNDVILFCYTMFVCRVVHLLTPMSICTMGTSLIWTLEISTPPYSGHLLWSICVLTNPWNQDTSIKWTPEIVPRVSGLERFHCTSHLLAL